MPVTSHLRLGLGAFLIAALAFAAGHYLGQGAAVTRSPPTVPGFVWPPPPRLEPFTLTDAHGRPFDLQRLSGKWTLLFFGYTHCPDICPITLASLQQVHAKLSDLAEYRARGQVVFVSVDGERDTPAVLRQYTAHFHPDFVAASAAAEALRKLTRQFGIQLVRVSTDDPREYWFDHPASVLLISPEARVIGDFVAPLDAADVAAQARAIIEYGVPDTMHSR